MLYDGNSVRAGFHLVLASALLVLVDSAFAAPAGKLTITPAEIRQYAPGWCALLTRLVMQPLKERYYRSRGQDFRAEHPEAVRQAYDGMDENGFRTINSRQDWLNLRYIPQALNGTVSDGPIVAIDMGCGPGTSTAVLANYLNPQSKILGIDLSAPLIEMARKQSFQHLSGVTVPTEFSVGSATETFRWPDGKAVDPASVDFFNSSGTVGHYLNAQSMERLAVELERVIKSGGHASLDNGPELKANVITPLMQKHGFRFIRRVRLLPGDPRGQLVFERTNHQ